jgi:hypothetical protein
MVLQQRIYTRERQLDRLPAQMFGLQLVTHLSLILTLPVDLHAINMISFRYLPSNGLAKMLREKEQSREASSS